MLQESDGSLVEDHDLLMFDLDGVVYVSGHAIPGVPGVMQRIRESQTSVAFVTNNASRTASTVAGHLRELSIEASPEDVVTSAQAAATVLLSRYGVGARVLALGADGLLGALRDVGLVPVTDPGAEQVVAVVTGYGPDVLWKDLMQAAVRIRDGLDWVACNTDLTIPTAYGTAPGHGAQVQLLQEFSGVRPTVAGKPSRPLLDETVARVGARRPLMIGDRLDTDIEGAAVVGHPSLLVLTGVTGLPELLRARGGERPTYICATLEGIFERHRVPETSGAATSSSLGGWEAQMESEDCLVVEGGGAIDDWWRVVATTSWLHRDASGRFARSDGLVPPD